MKIKNIFKNIPDKLPSELTEILMSNADIRVERIVSRGHASPPGYWYDQKENEFVVLISGRAKLVFEDKKEVILKPGDYINIPPRLKHRVEWTLPEKDTVWLAVFYK